MIRNPRDVPPLRNDEETGTEFQFQEYPARKNIISEREPSHHTITLGNWVYNNTILLGIILNKLGSIPNNTILLGIILNKLGSIPILLGIIPSCWVLYPANWDFYPKTNPAG
jgi:hypothetical protein